jgi:hypothetical protein
MVGHPSSVAGRLPIFADGPLDPRVMSLAASKTRVQDATFTGDASLRGGILLTTSTVDTTLKDSIEGGGRNILGLGGEVNRMGMSRRV